MITPDELIQIEVRHQLLLERAKTGIANELDPFLDDLRRRLRAQLAQDDLTTFSRNRLEVLLALISGILRSSLDAYHDQWMQRVRELAQAEAAFEASALQRMIPEPAPGARMAYVFALPSAVQISQAVFARPLQMRGASGGLLLEPFFRNWQESAINAVLGEVRIGYAQGDTTPAIVRRVIGTQLVPGAMDRVETSMKAMVRTTLQHVAQETRQVTWEANSDIVRGYRWVSAIDSRTSPQCQALDGTEYRLGKGPLPPAHINCRSTTVAVLDSRFDFLDEGATRRARNSEDQRQVDFIPAKTTYYGWLKEQSADYQDSIVGPARGKLLRNGGLSAERFADLQLNNKFEPISLEEMRKLEPLAFERAGI